MLLAQCLGKWHTGILHGSMYTFKHKPSSYSYVFRVSTDTCIYLRNFSYLNHTVYLHYGLLSRSYSQPTLCLFDQSLSSQLFNCNMSVCLDYVVYACCGKWGLWWHISMSDMLNPPRPPWSLLRLGLSRNGLGIRLVGNMIMVYWM